MQALLYIFFTSIYILPYLHEIGWMPHQVTLLPDLMSGIILFAFLYWGVNKKKFDLGIEYLLILFFLALTILFGVILNALSSGIIVAGIRNYLKFIPLFLLPAAYQFTERQFGKQLLFLLGLALIQLPVAAYQRLIQFSGVLTGDVVTGTLKGSGNLTIFVLSVASVLTGFYLKGFISRKLYLPLLIAIFIPATINETKVTLFLLPVALLTPILFAGGSKMTTKRLAGAMVLGAVLLSVFISIYDYFQLQRRPEGILDFLSTEERVSQYMQNTGRIESLVIPVKELSETPTKLFLGLGIGNVSESFLGQQFSGLYYKKYGSYVVNTLSQSLWEIGVIGLISTLLLFTLVLRDTYSQKRHNNIESAFALGWIGVLAILGISLVYSRAILSNEIGFLLFYFSGYIAANAIRKKRSDALHHMQVRR